MQSVDSKQCSLFIATHQLMRHDLEILLLVLVLQGWLDGLFRFATTLCADTLIKPLPMGAQITIALYFLTLYRMSVAVRSLVPLPERCLQP